VIRATPLVRIPQIGFPVSKFSFIPPSRESAWPKSCTRSKKPSGGSSASPPIRKYEVIHALPAHHLEQPQDVFPLAEAIEKHSHRPNI